MMDGRAEKKDQKCKGEGMQEQMRGGERSTREGEGRQVLKVQGFIQTERRLKKPKVKKESVHRRVYFVHVQFGGVGVVLYFICVLCGFFRLSPLLGVALLCLQAPTHTQITFNTFNSDMSTSSSGYFLPYQHNN